MGNTKYIVVGKVPVVDVEDDLLVNCSAPADKTEQSSVILLSVQHMGEQRYSLWTVNTKHII